MQLQWKDATENIVPNTILEKVQKFSDVIVFGAGLSGDWAVNLLRKYGIYPKMYCDNYKPKWGTTRNQLRVDSFENAISQYPKVAICIASMWGEEILKQIGDYDSSLLERTWDLLTSMNWETVGGKYKSSEIGYIKDNIDGFERLYNELGDEISRKTLEGLLNYRLTRNKDFLKGIKSDESVYLDRTIVTYGKVRDGVQNRILIDGGAFDGDTIEQFVTELGDKTLHIVCYELEHKNCQKLMAMKDKYMNHNIEIHESALWSSDGVEMNFEGNGLSGTVIKSGTNMVKSGTIDMTIRGRDVGFIKLDIEGAEREALKGAVKTIKRCRPLLAVCAYHLQDDLLVLSDFIKSLDCGYEIKLRHYMCSAGDTIMYAVPN
jgi:FkbM family methyltransferase